MVEGLEGGETYRHRVVGVRGVGSDKIEGPPSNHVDTTLTLPDKVRRPTGSPGQDHGEIELSWSAANGATGYQVRQKPRLLSDTWVELPGDNFGITLSGTTAVVSNLDPDETYVYQVRGTNIHGEGEWSDESEEIAVHDERPTQPQDLRGGSMKGGRGILLRWRTAADASGYEVEVSPTASTQQTTTSSLSASHKMAEIIGLTPGTNYTFTVRAWKTLGTARLHSRPSEVDREAPEPSLWWGHQADHNVKYARDPKSTT